MKQRVFGVGTKVGRAGTELLKAIKVDSEEIIHAAI